VLKAPSDIEPVEKRLHISSTGSTSSIGTCSSVSKSSRPRIVCSRSSWSFQKARKLLIGFEAAGAHSVLQSANGKRIPLMQFAVAPPIEFAARVERKIACDLFSKRYLMLFQ